MSTWSIADKSPNIALSSGALTATTILGSGGILATTGHSWGKWYFEIVASVVSSFAWIFPGVANRSADMTALIGGDANGIAAQNGAGGLPGAHPAIWRCWYDGSNPVLTSRGRQIAAGDKLGVAVDVTNGLIWWSHNGIWLKGDPAAGTGGTPLGNINGGAVAVYPALFLTSDGDHRQAATLVPRLTAYAPPAAFSRWDETPSGQHDVGRLVSEQSSLAFSVDPERSRRRLESTLDNDRRPICFALLTCIGIGPRFFLPLSNKFSRRYHFRALAIFDARKVIDAMFDFEEEIHLSDVFIYHSPDWLSWLGDKFGAYEELLSRIPDSTLKISIPLPHFHPFWPFHSNDPRNDDPDQRARYGYGDSFILNLLKNGVPPEDVILRYLTTDIGRIVDLDHILSSTLSSATRNERSTDIKVVDYIAENFKQQPLFYSVNHANEQLLLYISNQILDKLGCDHLTLRAIDKAPRFFPTMPIHPAIARHFGVKYATDTTRYETDQNRSSTFAEYIRDYVYFRPADPNLPQR